MDSTFEEAKPKLCAFAGLLKLKMNVMMNEFWFDRWMCVCVCVHRYRNKEGSEESP